MTIYITSGCFDILHKGHEYFFEQLVWIMENSNSHSSLEIYLNSDESIKKLKGNNRPINTYKKRKDNLWHSIALHENAIEWGVFTHNKELIIRELKDVDLVDILDNEFDYTDICYVSSQEKLNLPVRPTEIDFCIRNKIRMMFLPYLDGHSTTKLIESGGG